MPSKLAAITPRAYQMVMRFVTKDDDGCWRYRPPTSSRGRPRVTLNGVAMAAYEAVWLAHTREEVPPGMMLLHSCDNGEDGCVNPAHLRIGTPTENNREAVERGRHRNQNKGRTHCIRGHALVGANVRLTKDGRRQCRTCERERRNR